MSTAPIAKFSHVESERLYEMARAGTDTEDGEDVLEVLMRCVRRGLQLEYLEGVTAGRYESEAERDVSYEETKQ